MVIHARIEINIKDHTVVCENCKDPVIIENASPRIMAGTNRLTFLCGGCDNKDRNGFPVSANYNLYKEA